MQARRTLPMLTVLSLGALAFASSALYAADAVVLPLHEEVRFNAPVGGITLFKPDAGNGTPKFGPSSPHRINIYALATPHFSFGYDKSTDFKAASPGLHIALPAMTMGWRSSRLPETEPSNPISRTLHYMSQFYGHSPSAGGQNSLMRREQMHGRSVHLHVRF